MAARTSWQGYLRLNLLSVPVKAYNASISGGGKIGFHLVHTKCNSRIRYKKVCPIHGEVPNEEISSAYEFAKGKYITVGKDDLEKLQSADEKTITIDVFIRESQLDPIYYSGRSYYLVPDGRVAEKPYAVLQRVMAQQHRQAVAQVVFSGKDQLVLLRPVDNLLVMTMLQYDEQVKKPTAFEDEAPDVSVGEKELKLAQTLVEASTVDDFDLSTYQDEYTSKLSHWLEARAAGKKIARPHEHEEPVVINLMEALQKSLDRANENGAAKARERTKKPAKKRGGAAKSKASSRRKTG